MSDNNYSLPRSAPDARLAAFRKCCLKDPNRTEIAEWLLAITMSVVGVHLLLYPESLASSHMAMVANRTVAIDVLASICLLIGFFRLGVISRKVTTNVLRMRAILATASVLIWMEMVVAFASRFTNQPLPPGFDMMVICQIIGDLWVASRVWRHCSQLKRKGLIV